MAGLNKILDVLKNAKIRTFIIFMAVLLTIGGGILAMQISAADPMANQTSTTLSGPMSIDSTPGDVTSEKYRELQLEANKTRAEEAAKQKGSAIPTLIAFRSNADCVHGRYNDKGECDPNGIFDKDGHKIYDDMGNLLCESRRYNQRGDCDPAGLYDISGNLVYDEFGNLICTHNRFDAQGRCDPNGKFDKSGNSLDCPAGKYDRAGKCDPNGQFDKNGKLIACPSDRYDAKGACDPNGDYDRNGVLVNCVSGRYNAQGMCDPKGEFTKDGKPYVCPSERYNASGACDPNGTFDRQGKVIDCPSGRYNKQGECDPKGEFTKDGKPYVCPYERYNASGACDPEGTFDRAGVRLECPAGRYNREGLCDPNGAFDKAGKPLPCPSMRYNASGACDPNGQFDIAGKPLTCPEQRYDAKGNCDPKGAYDKSGKPLPCSEGKYNEKGECDANGKFDKEGKPLNCPSDRYNQNGDCDPKGSYGRDGKILPQFAKESETDRRIREQRARQEQMEKDRLAQAALEKKRAEEEARRKAYQESVKVLAGAMQTQAGAAVNDWKTINVQAYVLGNAARTKPATPGAAVDPTTGLPVAAPSTSSTKPKGPVIKAGTIMYGVLDTGINSDEPSPVLATVVHGKYKGTKLIGAFTTASESEKAIVTFTTFSIPTRTSSIETTVVAIDPETARTALASDVDHHYLLRYGTLFASSFMEGFATAVKTAGTTTTTTPLGGSISSTPPLNTREKIYTALGTVGEKFGKTLSPLANRKVTITVDAGTSIGLLFTKDLEIPEEQ